MPEAFTFYNLRNTFPEILTIIRKSPNGFYLLTFSDYKMFVVKSIFIYISDVINSALLTSDKTGTLSSLLAVVNSKDLKNIM